MKAQIHISNSEGYFQIAQRNVPTDGTHMHAFASDFLRDTLAAAGFSPVEKIMFVLDTHEDFHPLSNGPDEFGPSFITTLSPGSIEGATS